MSIFMRMILYSNCFLFVPTCAGAATRFFLTTSIFQYYYGIFTTTLHDNIYMGHLLNLLKNVEPKFLTSQKIRLLSVDIQLHIDFDKSI